ncbi:hypothetical protein P5673_022243 [Acropora cervicornis]|uniref:Uncharacterized protein n=1 Tax=Acropora cervicornis TaxID=6130 RepID=A0AAD9UZU4_ACRCE|nr:hypothetical protein P5673_022243 [Acropora cervicornis]
MVSVLWAAGCFQGLLVVARFVLNLLNFIPAAVCVYHTAPTEHCEVDNKSYHILGNQQAGTGNAMESCNNFHTASQIEATKQAILTLLLVCEKEETEMSLLHYEAEVSSQRRGGLDSNDNSCESIARGYKGS